MKLAPIAAPQWAFKFHSGDYHMVPASWIFDVPGVGQYYSQSERDTAIWVMVNGYEASLETLARGTTIARADEAVLPNFPDSQKTLKGAWTAARGLTETPSLMFVPRAEGTDGWKKCLDAWIANWEKAQLGPRLSIGICQNPPALRKELIMATHQYPYAVHLLGVESLQSFLRQDLPLGLTCAVRGVDTSLPFALGARGFLLTPASDKVPLDAPMHYARIKHWNMRLIHLNIRIFRWWLEEGVASHYFPITLPRIVASEWVVPGESARAIFERPEVALRLGGCPIGNYELTSEGVRPLAPGERPDRNAQRLTVVHPLS